MKIGPLQFQPGELAKIALIVFLAGYLREKREVLAQGRLKDFGPLLLIWGAAMLVLVETNDLGSALLYFGIFLGDALRRHRPARCTSRSGSCCSSAARRPRTRRSPRVAGARRHAGSTRGTTCTGSGYQTVQGLVLDRATAASGAPGSAAGRSRPRAATDLIPYLNTDFIYSALAQELGLIGAAGVLLVYMVFVLRGFRIAIARRGRLLEAARRRAHVRLRAADVHHRRRRSCG